VVVIPLLVVHKLEVTTGTIWTQIVYVTESVAPSPDDPEQVVAGVLTGIVHLATEGSHSQQNWEK